MKTTATKTKQKLDKTERWILEHEGEVELKIFLEKKALKKKLRLISDILCHYLPANIPHVHAQLDLIIACVKPVDWSEDELTEY